MGLSSRQPKGRPRKAEPALTDEAWIKANSAVITKRYAREWIAVFDRSIIAHGKDPDVVHQSAVTMVGHVAITMKHIEKGIVIL